MKRISLIRKFIVLLFVTGIVFSGTAKPAESAITFYKIPLVCNAAPNIGCGSRAKPVLLEMEKNPAVKEAWLNRSGTMLAIVWKDKPQTQTVASPIFKENSVSFTALKETDAAPYLKTFRNPGLWYHGADVDMLSREEASTIAISAVKFALENKLITQDEALKIKTDAKVYFKKELVKIRTSQQLNDDSQITFKAALYNIAEKHIGKERAQKAMELYQQNCKEQCKKDGACTSPGVKKDCCSKEKTI
jgi:hypothetical protein